MFDIGWSEMLVIAVVMIVVVGPKDLPKMLRTVGKMTAKMRSMAGDFQRQFNEALKEAELDEVKKSVDSLRSMNPVSEVKKQLNPFEKAAADVRAGLQSLNPTVAPPQPAAPLADAAQPAEPEQAAVPVAHEAEPLKNGATAMPGVAGPEAMPAPPVLATPAPSPEPAKPGAPAALMADPSPAKVNGTASPVAATPAPTPTAPAKAATKARATVSGSGTKAATTKNTPKPAAPKSAAKAAPDKPKSAAKAPVKSKPAASDKKSGKTT